MMFVFGARTLYSAGCACDHRSRPSFVAVPRSLAQSMTQVTRPARRPIAPPVGRISIGEYLIQRLQDYGVKDVFGIPGDYVLSFYSMLEKSPINVVGCTREDCAGFAADAYARINGLGAICVTYCVGGLSVCNSIAGAYAEKSPVVLMTGSPGLSERHNNPLLHHKVRDFHTQIEVFEKLCVACVEVNDPVTAFREIDAVLAAAVRFKRPVYIDIPRDMVDVVPQIGQSFHEVPAAVDPDAMREAAEEARAMLERAERPVILAGVEIHRFGLQAELVRFAEQTQIPVATTLLGKSVIRETHPLFAGLYEGAMGRDEVTQFVEDSDAVLMLGTFMTDINMGIWTADLKPSRCIYATSESLRIRHHHYHDVDLTCFLGELIRKPPQATTRAIPDTLRRRRKEFQVEAEKQLTITRMMARINAQLTENTIVICDIGDSLFAATELEIAGLTEFISPAYYTSMGFATPAALGACVARPDQRVLVVCGDGAFQMTGQELSSIIRNGFSPIVIVINNGGYGTERYLHAGEWKYNEIANWAYHRLPEVYGGGTGYEVSTEGEFDEVLQKAWDDRSGLSLIHVHVPHDDASKPLRRLAERMSHMV